MQKAAKGAVCAALCVALCLFVLPAPKARAQDAPPDVPAGAWLVMDVATGQVLVAGGANERQYPASATKILTMALVLEQVDFEQERHRLIETSDAAIDALIPRASMIALGRGERVALEDLLYATKIESANDAAHVLAEYVGGSMEAFAGLMNEKVRQLGLAGSHFVNASGQPDEGHYVTAYDMAVITRWALGVPHFRELWGATGYAMGPTNMREGRQLHNANLAQEPYSPYYCEGVTGSKTGYTDQARYTLVTTARRGGIELACVVLACEDNGAKYTATNDLLDYCFNNFRLVQYPLANVRAGAVPVYGGGQDALGQIEVYGEGSAAFLLHNSLGEDAVEVTCQLPERYVMGDAFAPTATLRLPEGLSQQQGGALYAAPLTFSGLGQVLAENTGGGLGRMAQEEPVKFWMLVAAAPALLGCLVAGRVLYVQRRREKRRRQKLAAARALIPIRIAERPQPPRRDGEVVYRRPVPPRLRVAGGGADYPRRAGRAR